MSDFYNIIDCKNYNKNHYYSYNKKWYIYFSI